METPGETYLDYIGLPREHPRWFEVANAVSDALLEAAEAVMAEECREDPTLSAMLDERYSPWVSATVPGADVVVGMMVVVPDWRLAWLGAWAKAKPWPRWTRVLSVHRKKPGDSGRIVKLDDSGTAQVLDRSDVDVLLPVPFDLAPLVAEHRRRLAS